MSTILDGLSCADLRRELQARAARAKNGARRVGESSAPPPRPELAEFDDAEVVKALQANQKVIYGVDDRLDLFLLAAGADRNDADSVVALFRDTNVTDNGNGTSTLTAPNFGAALNLCASERFRNQPAGAFCTGFLVAPDIIATAGHCASAADVTTIRFVFGFRMRDANTAETVIANSEIYRGVTVVGRQLAGNGADWALVRVDRPVTNHRIAAVRSSGKIADGQAVHVIGHPSGLPTKFAGGAAVRDNGPGAFFVANLDTYGGNSGSPVFNRTTHEVEGILVRGENDFVQQGNCFVSVICPTTGCRGEDCTRSTEFAAIIDKQVQLGVINAQGRLWHTIRFSDATWQAFGDVEVQTGDMGSLRQGAVSVVGADLHVCAVNSQGRLWHTIRFGNGAWQDFRDVEAQTGDMGTLQQVAAGAIGADLHVCAVSSQGQLWHTIRFGNGAWQAFGDVEGQSGDMGMLRQVAVAAIGADLHVCAVNSQGRLWHTIRFGNGTWQPFADVEAQTGDIGLLRQVTLGGALGKLHVAAVNADGRLWHTIRRADGTWSPFADIEVQTGEMGVVSAAALGA